MMSKHPVLSMIIPVGPAEDSWPRLLASLSQSAFLRSLADRLEIILVACEGVSVTPEYSGLPGVFVVTAPAGRASQMNAGARHARGEVLWFVHADSQLDEGVLTQAWRYAESGAVKNAVGYFGLVFASDGPWLVRINAFGANLRSRLWDLPFGDQALLVERSIWARVGEFAAVTGEDLDWVVRARLHGINLVCLPGRICSSARKYAQHGWWHTTWTHLFSTVRMVHAARRRFRLAQQAAGTGMG